MYGTYNTDALFVKRTTDEEIVRGKNNSVRDHPPLRPLFHPLPHHIHKPELL